MNAVNNTSALAVTINQYIQDIITFISGVTQDMSFWEILGWIYVIYFSVLFVVAFVVTLVGSFLFSVPFKFRHIFITWFGLLFWFQKRSE